jgi:hypothetical protein
MKQTRIGQLKLLCGAGNSGKIWSVCVGDEKLNTRNVKVKVKVLPRTSHEGSKGE